jgi:predicted lipoprotein with Yx(FWY)xxD motif
MKMRTRNLAALAIVGSGLLAACSNGYGNDVRAEAAGTAGPSTTAAPAPSTTTAPSAPASSVVAVGHTELGDVLVNAQGRTLYGFTNDTNGVSSCTGGCAQSWPPVIVAADFKADDNLSAAKLHTVKRDDGTLQLAAGKWPLYTFAGDSAAGDVTGQGSGGKWFVVQPDGALHKTASAATPAGAPAAPAAAPTTKAPAAPTGY